MVFNIRRMLVILSVLLFFVIGQFNYYYHDVSSIMSAQEKLSNKNYVALTANSNNIFESLAKQFGNILKPFEYTVDLSGKQIFPNDTLKQDIVTNYKSSSYTLSSLKYKLLGFNITAINVKIEIKPSRIDETRTKVDLPLLLARNVNVTNGLVNLKYNQVNLGSIYGIYDRASDKMTLHIPINVALQYLPRSLQ